MTVFKQLEMEGEEKVVFDGKFNIVRVVQGNEHYWFLGVVAGNEKDWKVKNVPYDKRTGKSYVFETLKEGLVWSDFDLLLENECLSVYAPLELKEIIDENILDEKNREIFQRITTCNNPVIARFKVK